MQKCRCARKDAFFPQSHAYHPKEKIVKKKKKRLKVKVTISESFKRIVVLKMKTHKKDRDRRRWKMQGMELRDTLFTLATEVGERVKPATLPQSRAGLRDSVTWTSHSSPVPVPLRETPPYSSSVTLGATLLVWKDHIASILQTQNLRHRRTKQLLKVPQI